MGSKSRQILVSETTFNRLTAGLSSFSDTLDAVVSRAMDALDRAGAPASASAPKSDVAIRPYCKDGEGFRVVPINATRDKVSFTSLIEKQVWGMDRVNDPALSSLQVALRKAPMTWNGVALALVGYALLNYSDGKFKPSIDLVGSSGVLFGAQIAFIAAHREIPKNWTRVDAWDTSKGSVAIMQGLSAHQALQTIRRIMTKIHSDYPIILRLDLEWNNTPKAAFPGERGYIVLNDKPLTG